MSQTAVEHYLKAFERLTPANDWLDGQRRSAFESFRQSGFPSKRDEDWKYTDVRPITKRNFILGAAADNTIDRAYVDGLGYKDLDCHELVFVNGRYSEELSRLGDLEEGLILQSLKQAMDSGNEKLQAHLNQDKVDKNGFIALNAAFVSDGVFIYVPDNVCVGKPVNLLFLSDKQEQSFVSHLRNIIVMGKQTKATVVENYIGVDDAEYFTNTLTVVDSDEGAILEHYKLQQESLASYHIGNLNAVLNRDSHLESHSISLGGSLVRNDIDSNLVGEGASIIMNGLYLASGKQHVDNHTVVNHSVPHTSSEEIYRGVLDGHARGVFNGKVIVHKDAQKTDARQSNANLLMSDNAEVDTKPELEIYANDVKCSHGATIGQLDESMLFYLRSRAISEEIARSLLTFAFAEEVIDRIKLAVVRKRLETAVVGRLPDTGVIQEFIK